MAGPAAARRHDREWSLGAVVGWWLLARWSRLVARILALQPALGAPGLAEVEGRLRRVGSPRGFVQLGPGLPLKAYLTALASEEPGASLARVAGLALVNRLTRIVPVTAMFAVLHPLAAGAPYDPLALGIGHVAGWAAFYLTFWWLRHPVRGAGGSR